MQQQQKSRGDGEFQDPSPSLRELYSQQEPCLGLKALAEDVAGNDGTEQHRQNGGGGCSAASGGQPEPCREEEMAINQLPCPVTGR